MDSLLEQKDSRKGRFSVKKRSELMPVVSVRLTHLAAVREELLNPVLDEVVRLVLALLVLRDVHLVSREGVDQV